MSVQKGQGMMLVSDWNNRRKLREFNFSNTVLPLKRIRGGYDRSSYITSMDRDIFRVHLTVVYDFLLKHQKFECNGERALALFMQKRLRIFAPSLSSRKISRVISRLFSSA